MIIDMLVLLLYRLYAVTNSIHLKDLRGSWRIRKFIEKYFLQDRYIKTIYLGHTIYVCPVHSMGRQIFEGELYEPTIIKTIQKFVENGFSFMDIGANIGLHTTAAAFAKRNDAQVFISFEPQSKIFSVLKKNCKVNDLHFVDCRLAGVGDTDTFLSLNESITNNKGRSSFLPRENTRFGEPVKVSTLDTLFLNDKYLTSKEILLKIDTEGYELPIIKGGMKWLSRVENLAIICEVSTDLMEKNNMTPGDLFAAIEECGLRKYKIFRDAEALTSPDISDDQYNIIFYKGTLSEMVFSLIESDI